MVASYPGTVKVFSTHVNITESIDASHPNDLQAEVVAIENTLGLNPALSTSPSAGGTFISTSTQFATLAARLTNIETGLVADSHSQYMHLGGGDTITISTSNRIGLAIKAAASQTADIFQVFDTSSTKKVWIDSSYGLTVAGGLTVSGVTAINNTTTIGGYLTTQGITAAITNPNLIASVVKLAPSQTADAFQVRDSSNNVLFKINSSGRVTSGTGAVTALTLINGATDQGSFFGVAPAGFYLDQNGVAHLQGILQLTQYNSTFCTGLPVPAGATYRRFKPFMWRGVQNSGYPAGSIPFTYASGWGDATGGFAGGSYNYNFQNDRVYLEGAIYGQGTATVSTGTTVITGLPTPGGNTQILAAISADVNASTTGRTCALDSSTISILGGRWANNESISFDNLSYASQNPSFIQVNPSGWLLPSLPSNVTSAHPVYLNLEGISYYAS